MVAPVTVRGRDLRALAAIVSEERPDLPPEEGLPLSLLADLMDQIPCDVLGLDGWDSGQQTEWLSQDILSGGADFPYDDAFDQAYWENYWDCQLSSYHDRTGDLSTVVMDTDFYSERQWRSTGMWCDYARPQGLEHALMVCLPRALPPTTETGRYVRLALCRGPGPGFSEHDRAVLTLLRPHLDQAYLDAERRRRPIPRLTPRQTDLVRLLAAGHTNTQIARQLGISEGTVRTHLENIYEKLQVSSRTAAVTRAFADRVVLH